MNPQTGKPMSPLSMVGFVGQSTLLQRINSLLLLHGGADYMPGHMLFQGEDGSGRRSLARAFATALAVEFRAIDGRYLQQNGVTNTLLTEPPRRSLLCIRHVYELNPALQEELASILRSATLPFTCVVCINREAQIIAALRQAIPFDFSFAEYSSKELLDICRLCAQKHGLHLAEAEEQAILSQASTRQPGEISKLVALISSSGATPDGIPMGQASGASRAAFPSDLREQIATMSGVEFEHFITAALLRIGFHAETTRATGDGGIDIVAHLDHPFVGGKFLIQCKRYRPEATIGRPTLQEFCGAVHTDKEHPRLVFVTTSSFTREATKYAKEAGIRLIDGGMLESLLKQHGNAKLAVAPSTIAEELRYATKFADGGSNISHLIDKARIRRFTSRSEAQTWALDNRESLYGVELWETREAEVIVLSIPKLPQRLFQEA